MQSNGELDIADFKRYLLGDLPAAETEAIDREVISDESLEETLCWAESELMEEYLDETLSPKEFQLFRENFLVSPERLVQLRQISAIKNYVRCSTAESLPVISPPTSPESFSKRIKKIFLFRRRPVIAVFALLVVGSFAVFYLTANNSTVLEKEYARVNQSDLSDLAEFKSLVNLNLMSGAFRDSGGVSRLANDKLTGKVLFRLALPVKSAPSEKFKAELLNDGKIVFTQTELPFYSNANGQEMRLLLPAAVLKKGTYQINLEKETARESVFVYNFAVE